MEDTVVTPLKVVAPNSALHLRAILDFEDETGEKRTAGDEWLFEGPGTYIPRKEVVMEETIRATVIGPNQAIRLRARKECVDRSGTNRVTGEEWLVKKTGAYLPGAYEEVIELVNAYVLTDKLPNYQSRHHLRSDVDGMEYTEVIKLMEYLNLTITESGPRDRSLLKDYLYTTRWTGSYEDKIQDTVNKAMRKYIGEKKRLYQSYLEIEQMARTDAFKQELSPILEERFPKYMKQMQERMKKLKTDDIEICIMGWTCAGKSTFFNILVGEDIMPTHILPDTPCLVRLHNSQTRKIQFVAEDQTLKTVQLTDDPWDAKCKIKSILDPLHGHDQSLCAIDVYWPVPRLHENIVFVDTPGIGENNSLTQQVIKHVPNAAGYVFIINSAEAGGILEGGIIQLFKAITDREGQSENKLGNVLFICNKWDKIERQERKTVWEDNQKKLKRYFSIVEGWQIIHFSASVDLRLMQLRVSPTHDFMKILQGLEKLISRTMQNRFFDFFGWIQELMVKSVDTINDKKSALLLSNDELVELKTKTAKLLDNTKSKLESDCKKIETMVAAKKSEIIKDLQAYLKSSRVQKKACDWKYSDLSANCSEVVMERIHMLISEWAEKEEGLLKKASADIGKECRQLGVDIHTCLDSIRNVKINCCPEGTKGENIELMSVMAIATQVFLAVDSTLAVLTVSEEILLLTAGATLGPLSLALTLAITAVISLYRKKSQLDKLMLETLEKISNDESLLKLIRTIFELPFQDWIQRFRSTIQCEIASQQKLIQEWSAGMQRGKNRMFTLESLFHELEIYSTRLQKIGVEYYSGDSVSCECLSIDSYSVSTTEMFHLHDVTNFVEGKRLTLRVIHPSYSVFHLRAIENLKKMKHTNFMGPEGVVYSTSVSEEMKACGCSIYSLRLLVQKSIGDLEQYVFTNQGVQGSCSGESTKDFFQKMTTGIANGLSYVHEMGFVHGHLQLSSILLAEDMTPKLCDINILPSIQERNHSICIFHTAPEVIRGIKYGPKADIYSLGILLWELWYGRHTSPRMNLTEKSVCDGVRPKFEEKYPRQGWIDLMKSCWTESPDQRPSAATCVIQCRLRSDSSNYYSCPLSLSSV